jgi:hypothetical protein
MSAVKQFENPDDQFNYAINLLVNSYESKSEIFDNQLRHLSEEYENKLREYEKCLEKINSEKMNLEVTVERYANETKTLIDKVDYLTEENKKLEKFKNSILSSINSNEPLGQNNLPPKFKVDNGIGQGTLNTHTMNLNNTNTNYLSHNFVQPVKSTKNKSTERSKQTSHDNSINCNYTSTGKDNRIDQLIEKLNDSINNRLYLPTDPSEKGEDRTRDKINFHTYTNTNNKFNDSDKKDNENESLTGTGKTFNIEDFKTKILNKNRPTSLNKPNYESESGSHTPTLIKTFNSNRPISTITKTKLKLSGGNFTENSMEERSQMSQVSQASQMSNRNEETKSSQYKMSSKFFSDCRNVLKQEEYTKLIETLRFCNNNKIDKFEAFNRIEQLLQGYDNLLRDFKFIFPSN